MISKEMRDALKNASVFQDPEVLQPLISEEPVAFKHSSQGVSSDTTHQNLTDSVLSSYGPKKLTAAANRFG